MSYLNPNSLKLRVIDTKLRQESLLADPFTAFPGVYNEKNKSLPDGILTKVKASSGEFEKTIPLRLALTGSGISGRDTIVGNEVELETRQMSLRANTFGQAVATLRWGADAELNKAIGILQEVQPALSVWHKEAEGFKIREALCNIYSSEQIKAPSDRFQAINTNVIVARGTPAKVAFSTTLNTFYSNINAANTGATTYGLDTLQELQKIAEMNLNMEAITIDGQPSYLLAVPTHVFYKLRAATAAGGFVETVKYDSANGNPTKIDSFRYGSLVVMNDVRFPVVLTSATGAAFTYKAPGGAADTRLGLTGAGYASVGFLLGKGALFEFESSSLQFQENVSDYQRNVGVGAFRTAGWTAGIFAKDNGVTNFATPVTASGFSDGIYNKSSALVLFSPYA